MSKMITKTVKTIFKIKFVYKSYILKRRKNNWFWINQALNYFYIILFLIFHCRIALYWWFGTLKTLIKILQMAINMSFNVIENRILLFFLFEVVFKWVINTLFAHKSICDKTKIQPLSQQNVFSLIKIIKTILKQYKWAWSKMD